MKKIRYAVIGTGWIVQEAFLPAIAQVKNAEVVALVTGHPEKAQKLAKFHKIPRVIGYADLDKLAKSGDIDAVYVATPNSSHAEYAIRAMRHGVHALVEKPLAKTIAESKRMIAAAKAGRAWLITAYRLHNDPATLKMMQLAKDGTIGEPRHFTSSFCFQSALGNHRLKGEHWGGPLQDVGVYCLNAARHVFGENPIAVSATASYGYKDKRFRETEEGVAVTLQFSKGRMAQFYCGFGSDLADHYEVLGTKGSLRLNDAYRFATPRTIAIQKGTEVKTLKFADTDNFSGMIAYVSDCIQKKKRPAFEGEEGLADMEALVAILKSAATGETVKLKSVKMKRQLDNSMSRSFPPGKHRLLV
jgi:predicted dehydrogenase